MGINLNLNFKHKNLSNEENKPTCNRSFAKLIRN